MKDGAMRIAEGNNNVIKKQDVNELGVTEMILYYNPGRK